MTYRETSSALAWHLASLATTTQSRALDAHGLDVALIARHETIQLVQETIAVGTRRATPGQNAPVRDIGMMPIAEVLRDPVRGMEYAVRALPTIRPLTSFTDLQPGQRDATAETWRQAARWAILARHDLTTEVDSYRGTYRWSLVADAAAIVPVVLHLDRQLAATADRLHARRAIADALNQEVNNPAGAIAPRVTALARAGDLPSRLIFELPPDSILPVRVTSAASFLEAQRRLPFQLEADDVSPATVTQTATGQAWLLERAATLLEQHNFAPGAASTAREFASRLNAVPTTGGRLVALAPGDDSARIQTSQMTTYLAGRIRSTYRLDGSELLALRGFVLHSPKVIDALSRTADTQLTSGRWLVPANEGAHTWTIFDRTDAEPPRLVTELEAARFALPPMDVSARTTLPSARGILANLRSTLIDTRPYNPSDAITPRRSHSV